MTSSSYKIERIVFALILGIALLMFLGPLVRLHGPNGRQVGNAFNVSSELSQFQSNLRIMATNRYSIENGTSLVLTSAAPAAAKPMAIPFSLRTTSLVPWFVLAAMGFCLLALLNLFFSRKAAAVFSLLGGCAGAIAALHLMLMGSDLQSWTEVFTSAALLSSRSDPSGMILMANSFFVSPGFGLNILTGCLFLMPVLSFTRGVPRLKSTMRHGRRVSVSQPVYLRPVNSRYPGENCTSLEASEGGLLLESLLDHYYAGMEVYFSRNAGAAGSANPEEHGSVVRAEKMQDGKCHVAVRLIPQA